MKRQASRAAITDNSKRIRVRGGKNGDGDGDGDGDVKDDEEEKDEKEGKDDKEGKQGQEGKDASKGRGGAASRSSSSGSARVHVDTKSRYGAHNCDECVWLSIRRCDAGLFCRWMQNVDIGDPNLPHLLEQVSVQVVQNGLLTILALLVDLSVRILDQEKRQMLCRRLLLKSIASSDMEVLSVISVVLEGHGLVFLPAVALWTRACLECGMFDWQRASCDVIEWLAREGFSNSHTVKRAILCASDAVLERCLNVLPQTPEPPRPPDLSLDDLLQTCISSRRQARFAVVLVNRGARIVKALHDRNVCAACSEDTIQALVDLPLSRTEFQNLPRDEQKTFMRVACISGNASVLKRFLDLDFALPDDITWAATLSDSVECLEILRVYGHLHLQTESCVLLIQAIEAKRWTALQYLVRHGVNVNVAHLDDSPHTPLRRALFRHAPFPVLKCLTPCADEWHLHCNDGASPILDAVRAGHGADVMDLFKAFPTPSCLPSATLRVDNRDSWQWLVTNRPEMLCNDERLFAALVKDGNKRAIVQAIRCGARFALPSLRAVRGALNREAIGEALTEVRTALLKPFVTVCAGIVLAFLQSWAECVDVLRTPAPPSISPVR